MKRADFRLLRALASKVSWENSIEGVGVHQCWSSSKHHFLRAIPKGQKANEKAGGQLGGAGNFLLLLRPKRTVRAQ